MTGNLCNKNENNIITALKIVSICLLLLITSAIPDRLQAAEYESNELQIVITPDHYPILWMNEKKYGVDFLTELASAPLISCWDQVWDPSTETYNDVYICGSGPQGDSADYYKSYYIEGRGEVLVYFDDKGTGGSSDDAVVGTHQVSNHNVVVGNFGSSVDNSTYEEAGDTEVVGTIPGEFEVTPGGGARYTIPIVTPPGIAGMSPDLSLVYDSQSGNGNMGVGLTLNGLSEITRCTATIATDGYSEELNFDEDIFCLDGQRLVPSTTTAGEYRTEIESFNKVTFSGTASNPSQFTVRTKAGLTYIYEPMLNSERTRVWAVTSITDSVNSNNAITFHYTELLDSTYNTYDEYQIDEIRYAYQSGIANVTVDFTYGDRGDSFDGWYSGEKISTSKALRKITTKADGNIAREYRLKYQRDASSGGASMVNGIKLCGINQQTSETECYRETEFGWSFSDNSLGNRYSSGICPAGSDCKDDKGYIYYPDLNGDGLADVCYQSDVGIMCHHGTGSGFGAQIATGICATTDDTCQHTETYYNSSNELNETYSYYGQSTVRIVDINGDGLDDIAYRSTQGIAYALSNGNGFDGRRYTGIFDVPVPRLIKHINEYGYYSIYFPDIDGNGVVDLCYRDYTGIKCHMDTGNYTAPWNTTATFDSDVCANGSGQHGVCDQGDNFPTIRFIDLNNDQRDDLVYRGDHGMQAWYSNGNGFVYDEYAFFITTGGFFGSGYLLCGNDTSICNQNHYQYLYFADINADGLVDFCYKGNNGIECWRNTNGIPSSNFHPRRWESETGTFSTAFIKTDICANNSQNYGVCNKIEENWSTIRFVDINGDGKADLTFRSDEGIKQFLSTGTGFIHHRSTDICQSPAYNRDNGSQHYGVCDDKDNYKNIGYADFNGDGRADLVYQGDQGIQRWINPNYRSNVVTGITNGFGETVNIEHKRLTDNSVYTKGAVSTSKNYISNPAREIQPPMNVVASVSRDDGIGGQNSTQYFYQDLELNLRGRGLRGFGKTVSVDDKGIKQTVRYQQDFPFTGMATSTSTALNAAANINDPPATDVISQQTSTLKTRPSDAGIVFPYVSPSIEELREHGNTNWDKTVTTVTNYDDYGNVEDMTVTTVDGGSKSYEKSTDNDYYSDNDSRFYGRLKESIVTDRESDGTTQTRKSSFTYYLNGLLETETIEPSAATGTDDYPVEPLTTTHFYEDGYGNETKTIVSGPNITTRTTYTDYDASKRFPEVITNALGHKEFRQYDARFGLMTLQQGPYTDAGPVTQAEAVTTSWDYDGFGRETSKTVSDQGGPAADVVTTTSITYCVICSSPDAFYRVTTQTGSLPPAVTEFDMMGREVLQETAGFDGSIVHIATEYDNFGRVKKKSRPYYASSGSGDWTTMQYDDLDRVRQITEPATDEDGTVANVFAVTTIDFYGYSVADGGIKTVTTANVTDVITNQRKKTEISDVIGRPVKVVDNNLKAITYGYTYSGNAAVKLVSDSEGNTIITKTDVRDNKRYMSDPDMGIWTYNYNGVGELTKQTDARNVITTIGYDVLGRMETRTDYAAGSDPVSGLVTETTTWIYDTKYPGKLSSVTGGNGVDKNYEYDSFGRARLATSVLPSPAASYTVERSYDDLGRVDVLTYPNNFRVQNIYNSYGYLEKVIDADNIGKEYWKANASDAEGNITNMIYANGVSTIRTYEIGRLTYNNSGLVGSAISFQSDDYFYDRLGNLRTRRQLAPDNMTVLEEGFTYDNLNRLENVTIDGVTSTNIYDDIGNLQTKQQVKVGGSIQNIDYTYDTTVKKRLLSVAGDISKSFTYDANGSMVTAGNHNYTWTAFNKIRTISDGSASESYLYDEGRNRVRRDHATGYNDYLLPGSNLGAHYEREFNDAQTEISHRYHIYAAGAMIAIISEGHDSKEEYLHTDHLGSVTYVTDDQGNVVSRRSFDAFGQSRDNDWSALYGYNMTALALLYEVQTHRGYTGHEQMADFGLINMNGRIYDPVIGRFLSADPLIQSPGNMQNLNRYSYVLNNPLRYNDPSGHSLRDVFKTAAIFVASYYTFGYVGLLSGSPVVGAFAAGFVGARLSGVGTNGSIRMGIMAAFGKAAFGAIGNMETINTLEKIGLHGLAGGLVQELQGGGFKDGFLAAGFTQAFSPGIDGVSRHMEIRVVAAAIVGGTASVLGGGKFANGAITGAFSRLFNDESHNKQKRPSPEQVRARIAKVAESFLEAGGDQFAKDAKFGDFPPGSWKCNCFVEHALTVAGAEAPMYPGDKWPIRANDWANVNQDFSGWEIVDTPQPGDVAAFSRSDTGHVGIYTGGIGRQVIAAGRSGVGYSNSHFAVRVGFGNNVGATSSIVYRRWIGK